MNYELLKKEFIRLKKEQLNYINSIAIISYSKVLSEHEKIVIYRNIKDYEIRINDTLRKLRKELQRKYEQIQPENFEDVIVEFQVDRNYLSKTKFNSPKYKDKLLDDLGIDIISNKYKLTLYELIHSMNSISIDPDIIQNNQKLIEEPIYIFCGYYDYSEDCFGPCLGGVENYIYGVYVDVLDKYNNYRKQVSKKEIDVFEKDKTIIHSKKYVSYLEIRQIFEKELLNINNDTLNECVIATRKKIEELNYVRSPEYKERVLLDKIYDLYKEVRGTLVKKEILYSAKFLDILKETYQLPNGKIVKKEKVRKKGGKNSVIVIAINQNKEYLITFQNRINDILIAEFPSGFIEDAEDPIQAAKRELQEETGYTTEDLFIVDKAYTSPGIDNSITYIVLANNCIKTVDKKRTSSELIEYGLFQEVELKYLINNNIMSGSMNKLAYYNLINNVDDCNTIYERENKKIYKRIKNKAKIEL